MSSPLLLALNTEPHTRLWESCGCKLWFPRKRKLNPEWGKIPIVQLHVSLLKTEKKLWLGLLPLKKEVLGWNPSQRDPLCVELACSPRICVGFLEVL